MVITINQVIAFCLVGVLIAFIVVLGLMAGPAIELLKKSKTLVETGNEAVTETKSKLEEIENKVLEAAKAVIRDTSPVVKVIACVGIGLTLLSLLKGLFRWITGGSGLFAARRERRIAEREIQLSRQTIKKINRQSKLEREAFERAEAQKKKLQKKEAENARKAAIVAAAEARKEAKIAEKAARIEEKAALKAAAAAAALSAKISRTEKKAAAKAAKAEKVIAARAAKAEKKAAAIAARAERTLAVRAAKAEMQAIKKAAKAEKAAAVMAARLERTAAKKEAKKLKKAFWKCGRKAEKKPKKAFRMCGKCGKKAGKRLEGAVQPIEADIKKAKIKWKLAKTGAAVGSAVIRVELKAAKKALTGAGRFLKMIHTKIAERRAAEEAAEAVADAVAEAAWELE